MLKRFVTLCLLCFGLVIALSSPASAATTPKLSSLSISKSVVGGNSATLTVKLSAAAGSNGLEVDLATDTPELVTVPESVTVKAKKTSATVKVTTVAVEQPVQIVIGASDGTKQVTVKVTLTPVALSDLSLSASSVVAESSISGTVSLDGVAGPDGVEIAISADNNMIATMPTELTVPAGKKSAKFTIKGETVLANTKVVISVTDGTKISKETLTVKPLTLKSIKLESSSVTGSTKTKATITLTGAAGVNGFQVMLGTIDEDLVQIPDFVTIKAGAKSASVTVQTALVEQAVTTAVGAGDGLTVVEAPLTIKPIQVSKLSLSPKSVSAGSAAKGTVTLTAPAPFPLTVLLSTDCECALVNNSVEIPTGKSSASFSVMTDAVEDSTSVAVNATLGDSSKSAVLTVAPINITKVAFSANPATSGKKVTITVTTNVAAPEGGLKITLQSANSNVVPNAKVTIPAGSTSGKVTVTVGSVNSSTKVKVTATSAATSDLSASLVVDPKS